VVISVLATLPSISIAAGLTPGLYETTTTTNFPVAPGESARPEVRQECITESGLGGVDKLAAMPKDGHCQVHDQYENGGQFSYRYSCGGPLKSEGMVSGSATTFTMNITLFIGNGQSFKTSMAGRRIGDCSR